MPENPKGTVISVGTLPEVVSLREAVLKSVGYEVFSTAAPDEALSRIRMATAGSCCFAIQCETSGGDNWFESFVKGARTDES